MRPPEYPPAERHAIVDDIHGHRVHDPYRWLEDAASPATGEWLAGQDELWRRHAAALPARTRLRARGARLSDVGTITAPLWRGARSFFLRRTAGQEHAVLYVTGPNGDERALVDPMAIDPEGLTTLDTWQPDLAGRLLSYQVSRRGTEQSELYVIDVESRRVVDGPIDRCRYSPVAWLATEDAFYYVRARESGSRARHVYLHRVGSPATCDVLVFGADAPPETSYGVEISQGRWLAISASPGLSTRNDLWLADLSGSAPEHPDLRVVQRDADGRAVAVVGRDDRMYVVTDRNSPRVRMCRGEPANPAVWTDLVPEDPEAVLTDFAILDGPGLDRPVLVIAWIRHATAELSRHDLATGKRLGTIPLPGAGSIGRLSTRPEGGHQVWFTYTDFVTPGAVWCHDARTGETALWAGAPGGVPAPDAECHRLTCTSADGAPVRMTVIAPSGRTGPRPTILYGYGGFGIPLTPGYAADTLAWVEAGGVVAIAQLRGGGEGGGQWHRAGMRDRKQNVFDDFIAAAEKLIADGWTTPRQLGIWGESNGGLLVGAALTQRPELFAAAACSAPILDMVRYEGSGLGTAWKDEYGTAADPEQFGWLYAYSPYHRVREGADYPATLFTVFDGDSRVDPLHARKMCAALQWATGGTRPILLRREADVGHGARAAGRSIDLAADMLAFLAAHTGLSDPPGDTPCPGDAPRPRSEPLALLGDADGLDSVARADLVVDTGQVVANGADGDHEGVGDLGGRRSFGD
ncbi:MAG TPA: prolyl oligopeptidase family serine peptidase [Streptosporangiaceae bacterium]|nr:prolyl oligopeptidase family serine peptidase [Streptosporangiaceae bacterium]